MVEPVCSRMSEDAGTPEAGTEAGVPAVVPPAVVAPDGEDAPWPPQAASSTPAPTTIAPMRPPGHRLAALRVMSPASRPRIRSLPVIQCDGA
jgi:hypothetical protein